MVKRTDLLPRSQSRLDVDRGRRWRPPVQKRLGRQRREGRPVRRQVTDESRVTHRCPLLAAALLGVGI